MQTLRIAALLGLVATFGGCASTREMVAKPFTDPIREREMRFDFAQVSERDGDLHRAEKTYRELVADKPKDPRYQHRLGVVLIRQGKLDEGIAALRVSADQQPENIEVLNDLGYAYVLHGQYAAAEQVMQQALRVDGRNPRTINNLALAIGYSGRTQEAYELFRQTQSEADARANLAFILSQRGDLLGAIREYDRALSKNPEHKVAAEALIQLTSLQQELDHAAPGDDIQYASAQRPAATPRRTLEARRAASVELLGDLETE